MTSNLRLARIARWTLPLVVVTAPLLANTWPVSAAKPTKAQVTPARMKKSQQPVTRPVATTKTTSDIKITPRGKEATPSSVKSKQALPTLQLTALTPQAAAEQVDSLINAEVKKAGKQPAPRCSDEDFLRRVSFDIAGTSPSPRDVTLFGLDPDPRKREKAVARLLASPEYARNWARYWHDVVFLRATETRARIAAKPFENWLEKQFRENKSWDDTATAMLTATGDVLEAGQTGLIFAQSAKPDEVAAETSRIFLGIQIQCANCHDHPSDQWKREQFHELAAFFPRMQLLPKRIDDKRRSFEVASLNVNERGGRRGGGGGPGEFFANPERAVRLLDRDGDGKISKEEASRGPNKGQFFDRLLQLGDSDKDGKLSIAEIKKIPPPQQKFNRGAAEHFMPDLQDPTSKGTKMDPEFFIGKLDPGEGLSDMDRRTTLAKYITNTGNPWFAKAFVNRMWGSLLGEGFYMPIDDIGPDRTCSHPAALEVLSRGFAASKYDIHWLFRTITSTDAYQRQVRTRNPAETIPAFAAAVPTRLRADHLYDSLIRVLGINDASDSQAGTDAAGYPRRFDSSPRGQFHQIFNFDPSTLPDDVLGTIPQALFLMNSAMINNLIRSADSRSALAQIIQKYPDDKAALQEIYLLVHAREPSESELKICREYIKQINNRSEAFEDILWSLLNSTEFQTKR